MGGSEDSTTLMSGLPGGIRGGGTLASAGTNTSNTTQQTKNSRKLSLTMARDNAVSRSSALWTEKATMRSELSR